VEATPVTAAERSEAARPAESKRVKEPRPATSTSAEAKPTSTGAAPIAKDVDTPQVVPTAPVAAPAAAPTATAQANPGTIKTEAKVEATRPVGSTSSAKESPAAPLTNGSAPRESARGFKDGLKTAVVKRPVTDQQQEVERVRLVQRVAKALQTAQDRGGTLRIRLTPPELGALKIELIVRDGALSAKLEAETPAAKQAILENLPALRERLAAQEIKIDRFDVDLMQQSDQSGGERQSFADADTARRQSAERRAAWSNERAAPKTGVAKVETAARAPLKSGGLNVLA
jgi:flagellar hook-length control protein FliK